MAPVRLWLSPDIGASLRVAEAPERDKKGVDGRSRDGDHGRVVEVAGRRLADTVVRPVLAVRKPDWLGRAAEKPVKDSLNDILRQHAGLSLFVRPVGWTDVHVKLLHVEFCQLAPCQWPRPLMVAGSKPRRGFLRPSPTITTLSTALTEVLRPMVRPVAVVDPTAIHTVLSTLWPAPFTKPVLNPDLHLYFGHRVYYKAVRVPIMWNFPSASAPSDGHDPSQLPMMCYIGKTHLAMMRCGLSSRPAAAHNDPVTRLQRLRSKTLMPGEANHDAHFVAMLVAMAQRHFYPSLMQFAKKEAMWRHPKRTTPKPEFRDLKLRLLTHDETTGEFIVYTATVTAKFLDRFHRPWEAVRDEDGKVSGLSIEYTKIPIWPILGLRERLGKALGADLVGLFDGSVMETWDSNSDSDSDTDTGSGSSEAGKGRCKSKRKRELAVDVFNEGGCEEAAEDEGTEERLPGLKRRRLGSGAAMGVTA
ncbi:hypothetical protein GQ602_003698 [Ophiocordyceps camponoti-floridani]|uniref:Uncharacterized protein n=1 Tax=Ophiocordyceps camponoti-floridani TaxID=2030778 RepID=A0A8H4Q930_9HYPO|nr:hypothetical protein GQ602_003698 [Ophiocordyceps camponoti-floridani]